MISKPETYNNRPSNTLKPTYNEDNTVEEVKYLVQSLKKSWPDLCVHCQKIIKGALN